ncbi:Glutathione S-transferase [Cohaesibacter sp. ES.047]|uniref:glutathione S-transferase n=1 Tax=Cohaesibacter sp. ES.047 TaxID=1798205 RepID=UPI000BB7CE6C|nr:glutathione S-transferase [Cohaesibacter sp. ES.047]SNY91884.1 Glutathione S-transferase [Cohaesibacter sp. ES.047]
MSDETSNPLPLLYSFRRCPYAMRGRMGLWASGIKVELREIVLRDKPAHMLEISPKGTVPVLQLPDGRVVDESLDIMLWALEQNDPRDWLSPQSGTLDDMLGLIGAMDGDFKGHLDRYKYATRFEDADEATERDLAMKALTPLFDRLDASPQLFGARISLADIALFPFVRQFANTDRAWFDEAAPERLKQWLEGHEGSDLFAQIFRKWPVWKPGDPVTLFPDAD